MFASCMLLTLALSRHIGVPAQYSEVHPSLGFQCDRTPIGPMSAGVFKNNFSDPAAWVARRWWIHGNQSEGVWLEAGGAVGYRHTPVMPYARVGYSIGHTELFAAPLFDSNGGKTHHGLLLGFQIRF